MTCLVGAGVRSLDGTNYQCSARLDGGALLFSWEAHFRVGWHNGVPPSKEQLDAMARQARDTTGCARIAVDSGKLEKLAEAPRAAEPKLPAAVEEVLRKKPTEFDEFLRTKRATFFSQPPVIVGSVVAAIETVRTLVGKETIEKLVLRRWDLATGAEKESTDIAEDYTYLTTDRRHLIAVVTKRGAKREAGVYALESGKRVGAIVGKIFDGHEPDTFWPGTFVHVHGSRALIGDPRNVLGAKAAFLEAFDIEKGTSLWKHPIRPPPPPPGPEPPSAPGTAR